MSKPPSLPAAEAAALFATLQARFEAHKHRHGGLVWADVRARLQSNGHALWQLQQMEDSGGEPDVVSLGAASSACQFVDCAAESPVGRRSLCYDRAGWLSRKEHRPETSAQELASTMGITLLTEAQYLALQHWGPFDAKTSSWLNTPESVRTLGGAVFADHRFGRVFVYHNGAQSYYSGRGFRGLLTVD